ncbi:SnoaL-like domain-containing protein [Aquimarina macrocephali]|uniref:SnoaL-like domain-containing protein n=1 Tax=Aquimarina macrocephali TaxID=666563 RepID=UPI000466A6EC|nr:SnoaL-like domain-containing protein [Aquimarina macrocephali]
MTEVTKTNVKEQVMALNAMIKKGLILEAFEKFYANDVIMQENENPPTFGKDANRELEKAFVSNITQFRNAEVTNVLINDTISVVQWAFDFDHKEWGTRNYLQLAIQRWENGQIINEKFYYTN